MFRRIVPALFIVLSVAAAANAQTSASASASVFAKVIQPIAIAKTADLNFGAIITGAAGSVTVSPGGVETATGATVVNPNPNVSAAQFTVTGEPSTAYLIVLPGSVTISNGSQTMTVDNFSSTPTPAGLLSATGSQSLAVGAKLTVGANQAVGNYTGTFSVSVAY
jgi:hypothetical protein